MNKVTVVGKVIETDDQYIEIDTENGVVVGYVLNFNPVFKGQYIKATGFLEKKYLDANKFTITKIEEIKHD